MPTNHSITLAVAEEMTERYRQEKETILDPNYSYAMPLSETFDRAALDTLLAQTGCESIRIYYGMTEDLSVHAILVGVNSRDEDILEEINPEIMEEATRCPDYCPPSSPLNS